MAYIPGYRGVQAGYNDEAAYKRFQAAFKDQTDHRIGPGQYYQSDSSQFKTVAGINPNEPGWGNYVEPGWQLIGYGGDPGGRRETKYGSYTNPDTTFAILERLNPAAPAPAPAPPPPAAPPAPPQISPEAQAYRAEADAKLAEAQKMLDTFKIEQNRAEEARKLQEEMMIKSQAAMASNLAMSQRTPNLQISPASQTPQTAGTQPFKRRRPMLDSASPLASSLNIGTSNLLNV